MVRFAWLLFSHRFCLLVSKPTVQAIPGDLAAIPRCHNFSPLDHSCGALPLLRPLLQGSLALDRPSPRQPVVAPSPPMACGPRASVADANRHDSTDTAHGNGKSPERLAVTKGRSKAADSAAGHAAQPPVTAHGATSARIADEHQRQPLQQIPTTIARPQPTLEWPTGLEPSRRSHKAATLTAQHSRPQQQQQELQQRSRHPVPAADVALDNLGGRLQRLRIPPLPNRALAADGNVMASAAAAAVGRADGAVTGRPASIQSAEARGGYCPRSHSAASTSGQSTISPPFC